MDNYHNQPSYIAFLNSNYWAMRYHNFASYRLFKEFKEFYNHNNSNRQYDWGAVGWWI